MKKITMIVMALFMAFILVACDNGSTKTPAEISNANDNYLTFTYNNKEIKITKGEIYQKLKLAYGTDTAINAIDIALLKNTKNADGKTYWELITDEEIEKTYKEEVETLVDDETTYEEAEKEYLEELATAGYTSAADYKEESIHLSLAKKAYARDALKQDIIDQDKKYADYLEALKTATEEEKEELEVVEPFFTESEYENRYKALYTDKYFGIIVKFNTIKQAKEALSQLNIEIHEKNPLDKTDVDKLVSADTKTPLTVDEIVKAYIDLYNNQYAGANANYPLEREALIEGVHYTIQNGKITFKTDVAEEGAENEKVINRLYYTTANLNSVNSSFRGYFVDTMTAYSADSKVGEKWYTPSYRTYNNGSLYVFALKIATIKAPEYEDVEDEVYDALFEAELTTSYIAAKMALLRETSNLKIYDPYLETLYMSSFSDHEGTEESSDTLVIKNDYLELTADQLFEKLDKAFGKYYAADMAFQKMVLNTKYNTIYDTIEEKVINTTAWTDLDAEIATIRKTYDASYATMASWEDYLFYTYGVYSTEELKIYLLYQDTLSKYAATLGTLTNNAELWVKYKEKMDKRISDYYSLDFYQIVISAVDERGNSIAFEDWSEYQKNLGKVLIDKIWLAVEDDHNYKGETTTMFADIIKAYNVAPVLSTDGNVEIDTTTNTVVYGNGSKPIDTLNYEFLGIPLAAAKSAGLTLKYETQATYTNSSSYVQEFLDLGKWLWNNEEIHKDEDEKYILKSFMKDGVEEKYLTTTYGYHAYVNTGFNELATYTITNSSSQFLSDTVLINTKYILPTYEMVMQYKADASDGDLTSGIKSAYTTYYKPLEDELTGLTYAQREAMKLFSEVNITFNTNAYTSEEFAKVVAKQIKDTNDKLSYFKDVE